MSEVELLGRYWVGVERCFCGVMSDEECSSSGKEKNLRFVKGNTASRSSSGLHRSAENIQGR